MSCFDCVHHIRMPYYVEQGGDPSTLKVEMGGKYGYPNGMNVTKSYLEMAGQHVCLYLGSTFYTARGFEECPHEVDK